MQFLHTLDRKVAEEFLNLLNAACGYPNEATKTWTAVEIETDKDGAFWVRVPDGVYSPKLKSYIDAHSVLPVEPKVVVDKAADITAALEAASHAEPPSKEDGKLTSANFILTTRTVKEAVVTADSVEPK